MLRSILEACLPWMGVLIVAFLLARLLLRFSGARLNLRRLAALHSDQDGAVQSLSFVLTLPLFVMIVLFIVQVSQLMIGIACVQYAAYAAARAAVVWVPSNTGQETENQFMPFRLDSQVQFYDEDGQDPKYTIDENSPSEKLQKIKLAAQLACMPISPSRDTGLSVPGDYSDTLSAILNVYAMMDAGAVTNSRIPRRLENKLAYALAATDVQVSFMHRDDGIDVPLQPPRIMPPDYPYNEVGWQDPIKVTVTHHFALLPGPGRFLARSTGPDDMVSQSLVDRSGFYTRALSYSCILGNEGEKPLFRYGVRHEGSEAYFDVPDWPLTDRDGFDGRVGHSPAFDD